MKNYTNDQIETALMNKGFYGCGGTNGLVEIYRAKSEGGNYWEEGVIASQFVYEHENGHSSVLATVEDGTINGVHPTVWFNDIKSDLK